MATKAISALSTSYATLQAGDTIAVDRAGVTGKTTRAQLAADLLSTDGTGDDTKFVTGTTGSEGDAATWDAAGNVIGGIRLGPQWLATKSPSGVAQVDFDEFNAARFGGYELHIANLIPATDSVEFRLQTSTDGGSSFDSGASDYKFAYNRLLATTGGSGSILDEGDNTNPWIAMCPQVGTAVTEGGVSGVIRIYGPHLAKATRVTFELCYTDSSGNFYAVRGAGERASEADVDAVRLLFQSGNIESGEITLYGLPNS